MKKESVLRSKSYDFALRIVKCVQYLQKDCNEYVLSKQLIRSGTAIGALVREAEYAQSRSDFCHKLSIALKEASETDYWVSLLKDAKIIDEKIYNSLYNDCDELISMLVSSVKTAKKNINK